MAGSRAKYALRGGGLFLVTAVLMYTLYTEGRETASTIAVQETRQAGRNSDVADYVVRNASTSDSWPDSTSPRRVKDDTLTRLGSELHFDYSSCPKDSLVHTASKASFTPKHEDCPSLFIIGARKGGTTSLIQYLSKHPHFIGANLKGGASAGETMFFSSKYTNQGWDQYMSYFPPVTPGILTGESSVGYATSCPVPARIVDECGTKPKIVYLLRNPYHRFKSNHFMRVHLGGKQTDINIVFRNEWKELENAFNHSLETDGALKNGASLEHDYRCKWERGKPNMLYDSLYLVFISHWLCNYPAPENIMIINSEEFFQAPGRTMNQIFSFIGLQQLPESTLHSITSAVFNHGDSTQIWMKWTGSSFTNSSHHSQWGSWNC